MSKLKPLSIPSNFPQSAGNGIDRTRLIGPRESPWILFFTKYCIGAHL